MTLRKKQVVSDASLLEVDGITGQSVVLQSSSNQNDYAEPRRAEGLEEERSMVSRRGQVKTSASIPVINQSCCWSLSTSAPHGLNERLSIMGTCTATNSTSPSSKALLDNARKLSTEGDCNRSLESSSERNDSRSFNPRRLKRRNSKVADMFAKACSIACQEDEADTNKKRMPEDATNMEIFAASHQLRRKRARKYQRRNSFVIPETKWQGLNSPWLSKEGTRVLLSTDCCTESSSTTTSNKWENNIARITSKNCAHSQETFHLQTRIAAVNSAKRAPSFLGFVNSDLIPPRLHKKGG